MLPIDLRAPLLLIVLGATFWTFCIALYKPSWLGRGAWPHALLEGVILTGVWWALLAASGERAPLTLLCSGLQSGVAWALISFSARRRYRRILARQPGDDPQPTAGYKDAD